MEAFVLIQRNGGSKTVSRIIKFSSIEEAEKWAPEYRSPDYDATVFMQMPKFCPLSGTEMFMRKPGQR